MNSKIKNYVDVLFKDIPNTKKARDLKEEILSNLNEHFESHIAEGKSENQAYTDSLKELGDIDDLLKELEPDKNVKEKIDVFRQRRAKNTSISVMLYIVSVAVLILFSSIPSIFGVGNEDSLSIIGLIIMFLIIAVATGLIIYTHMSMPQDVAEYISKNPKNIEWNYNGDNKTLRFLASFMKMYWCIILVIYLLVSFGTRAWHLTWLIWIIGVAVKNAIYCFFNTSDTELKNK